MKKILIVDDDAQIRKLFSKVLQRAGFAVSALPDALHLLHEVATTRPDLVITDILMPNQDGLQSLRELKQHHPELRIVVISGVSNTAGPDYLRFARILGADAVVRKPVEPQVLVSTINDILAGPPDAGACSSVDGNLALAEA